MKKKREAAAPVEEKYDEVRQLVALGRERGFLSYDEINEMLPDEVSSSAEELEEVFSLFETHGIALVDAETREQLGVVAGAAERKEAGAEKEEGKEDESKPESLSGPLEKTNDPVRMYLREMGTVPLLNREGEVSIARRIERGERRVLKALSRSSHVLGELRQLGDRIRKSQVSPNLFAGAEDDDDRPEARLERAKQTITKIVRLVGKIENARKQLLRTKAGTKANRKARWKLARAQVKVAREFRDLLLKRLDSLYRRGHLVLQGDWRQLDWGNGWQAFLAPLRTIDWVVFSRGVWDRREEAGQRGEVSRAVEYLARYANRVAMSNSRLLAIEGQEVVFRYRDHHDGGT